MFGEDILIMWNLGFKGFNTNTSNYKFYNSFEQAYLI